MLVRAEQPEDHAAVHTIHAAAFDTDAEARLVHALRERATPTISLVAVEGATLVGHILLSPVTMDEHPQLRILGLAPLAVAASHRRRGVGAALVRTGLSHCEELGVQAVVVLGHPSYYPRFGFQPAVRFGIGCEYPGSEEAFMLIELQPGRLRGCSGTVKYHAAFQDL